LRLIPRRRKRRRPLEEVKRGVLLFLVFFTLSLIIHETSHLLAARALGYNPDLFYGVKFPNIYGYTHLDRPCESLLHVVLIFSAGGLGAGLVFLVLWAAIEDIVAKLLLSFFTFMQLSHGVLEALYGGGVLGREWLSTVPVLVGMVSLVVFRVVYGRLGWW
jgi:hypothetical protein